MEVIKVMIFSWREFPGLSRRALKRITGVLRRERFGYRRGARTTDTRAWGRGGSREEELAS